MASDNVGGARVMSANSEMPRTESGTQPGPHMGHHVVGGMGRDAMVCSSSWT